MSTWAYHPLVIRFCEVAAHLTNHLGSHIGHGHFGVF